MNSRQGFSLDREWLIVLKHLSLDPENVLRKTNLPHDLFQRDGARLNSESYFRLWRYIDEQTPPAEELPLKIAHFISADMFHPVLFAAFCSSNLAVAVRRIAEYKRIVAPMGLRVEESAEGLFIGIEWLEKDLEIPTSLAATELVYLTQIARLATRDRVVPTRVLSQVSLHPVDQYTDFFGVTPLLSEHHGIWFSAEDAHRPFLTANESMWDLFEPELRRRLSKLSGAASTSERVKTILLENVPSREATIEKVADRLALTPRTLQRRLKSENTTFKQILNSVRHDLARYYVGSTKISYPEIAFLIGFEETSSFYRSFKSWTSKTPETFRAESILK